MSHVGYLGIAIKSGYRGIGIGTKIMQTLIEESKKAVIKILGLDVHDTQQNSQGLIHKMGFEEVGRIPKGVRKKGKYVDSIHMAKEL